MLNEIYKPIEGHTDYEVSNLGNVRNKHGLILKTYRINSGYLCLKLHTDKVRTSHLVHRLVLKAFEGSSPLEVNHKDGDKHNNQLSNLEYVTSSENKLHALKTGLKVYNKPTTGLKTKRNTSGYYGVLFDKSRNKWIAHVVWDKVRYLHKRYNTAMEAAKARDAKVLELGFNERLPMNF